MEYTLEYLLPKKESHHTKIGFFNYKTEILYKIYSKKWKVTDKSFYLQISGSVIDMSHGGI